MRGFTRLLTSRKSPSSYSTADAYMAEIPTVVVEEISSGYPVVNRPNSVLQFVNMPEFEQRITEDFLFIAETDHILLRPLPNLATETTPAAFNFGYMVAAGQAHIVELFVPGLGGKTDPVGPSPLIISKAQLKQVAKPWREMTERIMNNREAVLSLGWVSTTHLSHLSHAHLFHLSHAHVFSHLSHTPIFSHMPIFSHLSHARVFLLQVREMWGYCIAAASLGIKHRVLDAFQFEGGSIGNRNRRLSWPVPPSPVGEQGAGMPYYIFHYTYGIEYTVEGLPTELQVGEWSLDKRHYSGTPPSLKMAPPPKCAHERAHVLRATILDAAKALGASWGGESSMLSMQRMRAPEHPHEFALRESWPNPQGGADERLERLAGTGPWEVRGQDRNGAGFR